MVVMTTCNWRADMKMATSPDVLSVLQASARNGTLLSSCQPEVKELMHQLDVIISAKQMEWERERMSLLIKLERKEKEMSSLRRNVLHKSSEIDQLKITQKSINEEYHARHADQEAQLLRLRSELKRLNHSYEQLKAKRCQHTRAEESCRQQCQSLRLQVEELKEGMALLEQQVQRRERELVLLEDDKQQKISILNESLKTKDELIRALEEQMNLTSSSVQFSSYEAELNQLKEAVHVHSREEVRLRNELKRVKQENQEQLLKMRENKMITELKDRVERLESQLREAHSQSIDSIPNTEHQRHKETAIDQFVDRVDQLACNREYVELSPVSDSGLSQALEGILDKHFNQLDSSLQAILSSPK